MTDEKDPMEEAAKKAFSKVPWQFVNGTSFDAVYKNGFRAGWKASRLHTLENDPIVGRLRDACEQALRQWEMYCTDLGRDDLKDIQTYEADSLRACKALLAAFDEGVKKLKE